MTRLADLLEAAACALVGYLIAEAIDTRLGMARDPATGQLIPATVSDREIAAFLKETRA